MCRANVPVIRCLHLKITANRHRFSKTIKVHFSELIEEIRGNSDWKRFFLDGGKETPPIEYLALVEKGLRSFGADMHAMGSGVKRRR